MFFLLQDKCLNGGTCHYQAHENQTVTVTCACPSNFSGPKCENCDTIQCLNGGTCRSIASSDRYRCDCLDGFTGLFCEVDKCKNFCKNYGKCSIIPVIGPKCTCINNYSGETCEIDDLCPNCNAKVPNCIIKCHNGGFCQKDGDNKEFCKCVGEWRGRNCELPPNCIDECGKCNESSSINECM